ncbi:Mce/MlaD family protein [Oscillatoria salina]|uniref:hypothetical protein n=1 Tax=Oscillatoria salina TaxID=331517 RepID=UPI0013BD262C|nr:hypothetical protein [Oscillatoria salina]MBZ8179609.1 hypothetical protein [Oscillatoria salina IIICB1]NET90129.1 hypothetical protein [Kamptonema sp. SIO1D9]
MNTFLKASFIGCLIAISGTISSTGLAATTKPDSFQSNQTLLLAQYPEENSRTGEQITRLLTELERNIDSFRQTIEGKNIEDAINDRTLDLRQAVDNLHDSFRGVRRNRNQIDDDLQLVTNLRNSLNNTIENTRNLDNEVENQWDDIEDSLDDVEELLTDADNSDTIIGQFPDEDSRRGQKINQALTLLEEDIDDFTEELRTTNVEQLINDRTRDLRRAVNNLHDSFRGINGRNRNQIDNDFAEVIRLRNSISGSLLDRSQEDRNQINWELENEWGGVYWKISLLETLLD